MSGSEELAHVREVPDLHVDGAQLTMLTEVIAPELVQLVPGDQAIQRWSSVGVVTDVDSALAWVRGRATDNHVEWAIRVPDGHLAGRVSLHRLDFSEGTAEIGYGLFHAFRGRGLARRVVTAVTTYGFEGLQLRRIELEHAVDNLASCGVATACGFALEGTRRQVLDDRRGGWDDAHLHARLRTD